MNSERHWRFFRAGGFDQVRLDQAEDLLALADLDQKLWVALSCPVKGIQFDDRTLAFIDADQDGHVRANELLSAIRWAAERLVDPGLLGRGASGLAVTDIRTDSEDGRKLAEAARRLVQDLGKPDQDHLTVEDCGVAQEKQAARALAAWASGEMRVAPLGEETAGAHQSLLAVLPKIDDFFLLCRLSAFDGRVPEAISLSGEALNALAAHSRVDIAVLDGFPLAKVDPEGNLPLREGVNPAWAEALEAFRRQVVTPILGERTDLKESDWRRLQDKFSDFATWQAARPTEGAEDATVRTLEQLVRYVRDLMTLANNFVAFRDFYTRQGKATFQAGTLYLDGRSCELCVTVSDPARHAQLATLSRIFLVYCDCVRGTRKMTIAAAFTAGDADQLMVGRNGVFYDRLSQDWDATIVRIIDHPISLRQAFWSPYKRFIRLVGEQAQKFASGKARQSEDRLAQVAAEPFKPGAVGAAAKTPSAPVQQAFDVGKFAGIFAAIGLAVGAIGTALASVVMGVLSLKWWQIPLALAGFMLVISGPAVLLAWFKLRTRNLGPILDANGWAINARASINIPFGASLTRTAELPPNAERSLSDPYAEKPPSPWMVVSLVAMLVAVIAIWWAVRLLLG